MKHSQAAPAWAIELVEEVCKDYHRALPKRFQWYGAKTNWPFSGGHTKTHEGVIHISSGTDEHDQQLVLLHELAHYILAKTKKGRREHHSLRFWKLAFELYKRYGIDLDYAIYREENYRVKATQAFDYITK